MFHRDIKPENLLVSLNSDTTFVFKWADFGFCKKVKSDTFTLSKCVGTSSWLAPEVLDPPKNKRGKNLGTKRTDVFSEGLVFGYITLGGIHPFGKMQNASDMPEVQLKILQEGPNFEGIRIPNALTICFDFYANFLFNALPTGLAPIHRDKLGLFEKMLHKNFECRPTAEVLSSIRLLIFQV